MGGKGQLSFVTSASSPPACTTALIVEAITLSHYCWQSSCSSRETPPMLMLPGHFNCIPQLKVFINFSPSPASSTIRSAACCPDRQSSEEHLQFKRDAYATVVWGLKVNRPLQHPAPPLPCLVSGVFYIPLLETLYFLPGLLPTRLAQWLHSPCGVLPSRPSPSSPSNNQGRGWLQQLQCWLACDKWSCHSSYWLAMLWHFPSKTQMWHGQRQEHRSGRNIMFAAVPIFLSASVLICGDDCFTHSFIKKHWAGESFAWVKGKCVLSHWGTEHAQDKPGSSLLFHPMCREMAGDSVRIGLVKVGEGVLTPYMISANSWQVFWSILSQDALRKKYNNAQKVWGYVCPCWAAPGAPGPCMPPWFPPCWASCKPPSPPEGQMGLLVVWKAWGRLSTPLKGQIRAYPFLRGYPDECVS